MPVPDSEEVSDRAIPSTRKDIVLHHLGRLFIHKFLKVFLEFGLLERPSFRHELNESISFTTCQSLVGREFIVLVDSFEQSIHQIEHFKYHLVLP